MATGNKQTIDIIKAKISNPGIISLTSSVTSSMKRGIMIGMNIARITIIIVNPMTTTMQRAAYFSLLISVHSHSLWNENFL